ncbi:bifunctional adenosylcobinamide kinase/adenosylcobinamide-phosphate guanylyltransferase [Shewanella schlegeliana]|uniref:Bifunctional adenosylcobalamin biosynthesis protein n=1 Tax=Shewanella schlegeliana TaxID=190308 RepID=A0ABS1T002_9GAMM|nr:bifunctional adenosylcobinamide kinase/adenosylcobinamide-phosphate guanylyltransferase [Shewanella schlegeliana]MBL4914019.1 bifunctional adenosylcobinamide kinase/adenosylcobinamide-phosphate guanylyltransferase [Shewanella schlegeliana]MCL1108598.1 bifunctional adenosylcobinamide kinase/adenosylcobinamide-phosphate guanylyltransferase [Shewanella schlegeliana]GIU35685.1 bifunctional adenosylcobinamide kinase/adenosylcobinamide-phosphate guanylyltransferase [Shewanella schlegeliana]
MISLYIGGARSGKSGLAEQEVINTALPTTYIATARASSSMATRIALHQQQRPHSWITAEVPLELTENLIKLDRKQSVIIVDCLTLWLTNQLMAQNDLAAQINLLCHTLAALECHIILVSTEVGQSQIPEDEMSQEFVNFNGLMHQQIAAIADWVCFCQAGMAIPLKTPTKRNLNLKRQMSDYAQTGVA